MSTVAWRWRPTAHWAPAAISETEQVVRIAELLGRTPAQELIRWTLQRSLVALPKPTHHGHIEDNGRVLDFELTG